MEINNNTFDFKDIQEVLKPVFGLVDETQWTKLKTLMTWVVVERDEKIISEGDESDSIYFVLQGRLAAYLQKEDGSYEKLGDVSKGQSVGELGIFTGERRNSSVRAIRHSTLIKFDKNAVHKALEMFPPLSFNVINTVASRARKDRSKSKIRPIPPNIIVALVDEPSTEVNEFMNGLVDEMKQYGSCAYLNSENLIDALNINTVDAESLTENNAKDVQKGLDRLESENDFVLISVTPDLPENLQQQFLQGDLNLIVKSFDGKPEISNLEKALHKSEYRLTNTQLVLLHSNGSKNPRDTKRFLSGRNIDLHHHIRLDTDSDIARIGRFATGNAIGVALSGGGARGFAHIGVCMALRKHRIPIDFISGTSAGSLAASVIAMDISDDEIMNSVQVVAKNMPTKRKNMNFFPFHAIMKGKDLDDFFSGFFKDQMIEDLWINFSCVAANLSEKRIQVINRGLLWKAVRASVSLPGLFPPSVDGNSLLIDGGVLENLPLSVLERNGINKKMIVTLHKTKTYQLNYTRVPDASEYIKNKVAGKRLKVPSFTSILMESMVLSNYEKYRNAQHKSDVSFEPPVDKVGFMSWKKYKSIIEDAQDYTDKRIKETNACETLLNGD